MGIVSSGQISITDLNDSKQLQLFIGSSQQKTQVYDPNNGSYVPNWSSVKPVLTPQLFIAGTSSDIIAQAQSVKWYEGYASTTPITTGTDYTVGTGGKTLTINTNILASKASQVFVCEVVYLDPDTNFQITTKADFEFVKVVNGVKGDAGVNAIIGVLSNESHSVPTDAAGNNGNFAGASTTLTIYQGASVSSGWTIKQTRSNVTVTEADTSNTATVTAMSADTGYVEFTATKSGYANVVKRFTLTKHKQGANATSYWLVTSVPAIGKNVSGVYNPTKITVSAKSQTGSSSPGNYSGRFIISESTDGSTFTAKYTSTANEASKEYTPSAGIKALKVQLYLAGGTTTLLDEQTIPVVSDGATGQDSVLAVVWTPDGNTLKNSSGSLTAQIDVYKGSTAVTGTAFKWYIQDPTATTSSGGDSDGGAGWRLLTSSYNAGVTGYTSNKITIPAEAISSVESFMCVVTYDGKKYKDVCTVIDVTDPISVSIIGGAIFKNGQGTTELTARLYQNGTEIDSDGSKYNYTWSIYNANNTKITPTYSTLTTGKTVTVDARDINSRANVICDISSK